MSNIIVNDYGQTYKKPSTSTTVGAVLTGSLVASGLETPVQTMLLPQIMKKFKNISKNVDVPAMQSAVKDAFEKSKLKEKGVEFLDLRENKIGEEIPEANKKLHDALIESIPKKLTKNKNIREFIDIQVDIIKNALANGNNAAYLKSNKIAVNTEKLGAAAFHEMGHALNANNNKLLKGIQTGKTGFMSAASIFALTALLKRKKVDGEHPKNNFDKVTTFIKNNVGKLVTFAFVPVVAEELIATHKGEKLAAQVLSKDMLKTVKKTNRLGATTYIVSALVLGLSAHVASKVRDNIAKPKEV